MAKVTSYLGRQTNMKNTFRLVLAMIVGAGLTSAGSMSYTCDPSVAAATCNYLNTTVAGAYSSTFSNANASIYIQYGNSGLASTLAFSNVVSYSSYLSALEANTGEDALQASALAALNTFDSGPYGSGNVGISAALESALDLGTPTGHHRQRRNLYHHWERRML
jgi:hypothetical protein